MVETFEGDLGQYLLEFSSRIRLKKIFCADRLQTSPGAAPPRMANVWHLYWIAHDEEGHPRFTRSLRLGAITRSQSSHQITWARPLDQVLPLNLFSGRCLYAAGVGRSEGGEARGRET